MRYQPDQPPRQRRVIDIGERDFAGHDDAVTLHQIKIEDEARRYPYDTGSRCDNPKEGCVVE